MRPLAFLLALNLLFPTVSLQTHPTGKGKLQFAVRTAGISVQLVQVTMQNDDFERTSTMGGEEGRSTYWFDWRDIPSGEYRAVGSAMDASGKVSHSAPVNVVVR